MSDFATVCWIVFIVLQVCAICFNLLAIRNHRRAYSSLERARHIRETKYS